MERLSFDYPVGFGNQRIGLMMLGEEIGGEERIYIDFAGPIF